MMNLIKTRREKKNEEGEEVNPSMFFPRLIAPHIIIIISEIRH